jgi:uncharacterized repeat protein (TIGR04076 family)
LVVIVYKVTLEVTSVKGRCGAGYKVGEKIVVKDPIIDMKESDRVCLYAMGALLPYLTALDRETAKEDWINMKEEIQCPDSKNTVVFKVTRLK